MKQYFKKFIKSTMMLAALCSMISMPLAARQNVQRDQVQPIDLHLVIEDPSGKLVKNALIIARNGRFYSDDQGVVIATVAANDILKVQATGYQDLSIDLERRGVPEKITLYPLLPHTGYRDRVNLPMQLQERKRYVTGAVSTIEGSKLISSPEPLLSNTLQGHGLGLVVRTNAGGMSNNPAGLFIRGLPREGSNGIISLVDGIERPIDHIIAEEIASIELLKDATTKILYGARAANGVLMITTKRGDMTRNRMQVNVDYGVGLPSVYPEFLDAYSYALLYNEARINDGMTPLYSEQDLQGYRNSSGNHDLRYPNVDYYNTFLRSHTNQTKISTEFSGGGDNAQYLLLFGYAGARGLEAEGIIPQNDRFNLRGNLDIQVNDVISAYMDVAGRFETMERSSLNHAQFFNAISTHRPNEYPLIIASEYLPPDTLGNPALGAGYTQYNNLLGSLKYSGYQKNQYFSGQTNFGLNFNFDDWVQGLSAKAYVTFDNYFFGSEYLNNQPTVYTRRFMQTPEGQDSVIFQQVRRENYDPQLRLGSDDNLRNTGFAGAINYRNTFGDHKVNADLGYMYALNELSGFSQNIENVNTVLKTTYAFKDRYIAEFILANMGSNKFDKDNRYRTFPAGGVAWVLSEESFLNDLAVLDYLKLKASAGILGYDAETSYFLYQNRWQDAGNVSFGDPAGTNIPRTTHAQRGNPNLQWEKSREVNVGLEGIAINYRLSFELNYFNEYRYDIIQFVNSEFPDLYGGIFPYINWGEVENKGFETGFRWNERNGDVQFSVGLSHLYSENTVLRKDEIDFPDAYRRTTGLPSDALMGYVSNGLFGKDVDVNGYPRQLLGYYGIGDLAYADLNNDGKIDDSDRKQLGNSYPRHTFNLDMQLNYKGFGLYAVGTAHLGVYSWLNNTYFWNRGEGKYSVLANDRYHPVNNPGGMYPRLTTTMGDNNFVNSDFWMENTSFFRLKNVELSYTFDNTSVFATPRRVKLYVRGSNLLVVSKVKDLDPEALNSGLGNYPVLTSLSAGVSVTF